MSLFTNNHIGAAKLLFYNFKVLPEAAWVGMISSLTSFVLLALAAIGVSDPEVLGIVGTGVPPLARFAIGVVYGTYTFMALAEVLWTAVQAGSGVLAMAIANTNDVDGLTAGFVAQTFSATGRTFLAALLAAMTGKFTTASE